MEYLILGGLVGGVWLLLLWLSIIVWVYRDIRERTRDLGLQVLAVFVAMVFFPGFNIPGLALYLMLRPHETLEEAYSRSLEEEALLRDIGDEGICPSCRRFVERAWKVCPFCKTELKDECRKCGQFLSFNWLVCPYCGTERVIAVTQRAAAKAATPGAAPAAAKAPAAGEQPLAPKPPAATPPQPGATQAAAPRPAAVRPPSSGQAPSANPQATTQRDGGARLPGSEEPISYQR